MIDEAVVRLHPLAPHLWAHVEPSMHITMHEGSRIIGHAHVLKIVPPSHDRLTNPVGGGAMARRGAALPSRA